MIKLAGLVPEKDIEIRIIGLRPGEKLCEELITEGEDIQPTYHEKIKIFRGPGVERSAMEEWLSKVEVTLQERDEYGVVNLLKELIPEYQPGRRWNQVVRSPEQRIAQIAP